MKGLFLLLGFAVVVFLDSFAGDTIPANSNLIEYTGRIDFTDSLAPQFSYSGVSVRACFSGTSIAAILDDDRNENYYNVILDGVVSDIIHVTSGKKTYLLAEGLSDTIHEIELFKRTELTFGKTKFFGFIIDEGAVPEPVSNIREYFIEYIGNSITCGYGNEGQLGGTFGPTTENHYLSYAAITSRNFNARHMAVSRSGIGIYRNYDGPAEGNPDCMTHYYNRIFLYNEQPAYDFGVQPNVVCINLGTNDFSTIGGDSALFVGNYLRLLDTIQTRYDQPHIVCLLGPMLTGKTLSEVRKYIQFVVDSANKRDLGTVSFFEMSTQGSLGFGIDYHPTVAQHEKNAAELTEYLKSLMNWKIHPRVQKASTFSEQHIKVELSTPVNDPEDKYAGFSLYNDNFEYSIHQVYRDTATHSVLHIVIEESLLPQEDIYLGYKPGTIESVDSVGLARIGRLPVENTLSAPELLDPHNSDKQQSSVELFPNPNNTGVLKYNMADIRDDFREMDYEIVDSKGVSVQRGSLSTREGMIDLTSLVNGMYYINFFNLDFRYTVSLNVLTD